MKYWIISTVALISAITVTITDANLIPDTLGSDKQLHDEAQSDLHGSNVVDAVNSVDLGSNDNSNPNLRTSRARQLPSNCIWTACEGLMIVGQGICTDYNAGWYMMEMDGIGCGITSAKHLCCKATPGKPTYWTNVCYGMGQSNVFACKKEFKVGSVPTGNQQKCEGFYAKYKYECTN